MARITSGFAGTMLHLCAMTGNAQLLARLVADYDLDVNVRDDEGLSPFHVALYEVRPQRWQCR